MGDLLLPWFRPAFWSARWLQDVGRCFDKRHDAVKRIVSLWVAMGDAVAEGSDDPESAEKSEGVSFGIENSHVSYIEAAGYLVESHRL